MDSSKKIINVSNVITLVLNVPVEQPAKKQTTSNVTRKNRVSILMKTPVILALTLKRPVSGDIIQIIMDIPTHTIQKVEVK